MTLRSLAIVVLASCSGAAGEPLPAAPTAAVSDPACAAPAGDADSAGDADPRDDGVDSTVVTGDDSEPRRKKLPRITACSIARVNYDRDAAAILAAPRAPGKPAPHSAWNH